MAQKLNARLGALDQVKFRAKDIKYDDVEARYGNEPGKGRSRV